MTSPQSRILNADLQLEQAAEAFGKGDLSSIAYADKREKLITDGLHAMAECCGIELKHMNIDAKGEISLTVKHPDPNERLASGRFGEEFAQYLSQIPTRTGIVAGKKEVLPENGWCHVNHFAAEQLVRQYADAVGCSMASVLEESQHPRPRH